LSLQSDLCLYIVSTSQQGNNMTIKEVAAKLKYTPSGVLRMIQRGDLSAKRHGREWNVSAASVARVLKQQESK
jgi:excisionase family DNA binding protein